MPRLKRYSLRNSQVVVPFTGPRGEPEAVALVTLQRKDAVLLAAAAKLGPLLDREVSKLDLTPQAEPVPGPSSGAAAAGAAGPPAAGEAAAPSQGPGASRGSWWDWLPFGGRWLGGRGGGSGDGAEALDPSARAEACKEAGNAAFKEGRYEDAVAQYSQALALQPGSSVYHNNRALVYLKLQRYAAAEDDAEASLRISPSAKAYLRRGSARMAQARGGTGGGAAPMAGVSCLPGMCGATERHGARGVERRGRPGIGAGAGRSGAMLGRAAASAPGTLAPSPSKASAPNRACARTCRARPRPRRQISSRCCCWSPTTARRGMSCGPFSAFCPRSRRTGW